MLCGRTYHTMDNKNRITVPQALRAEIGETVYITVGYDKNLFIMPCDTFNKLAEKVLSVPETSVESREFRRDFFGNAVMCQFDKTGRLILPSILIDHAKIQKDVVIIGIYDKLEVWSKESYDAYTSGKSAESTDIVLEKMALHGV